MRGLQKLGCCHLSLTLSGMGSFASADFELDVAVAPDEESWSPPKVNWSNT